MSLETHKTPSYSQNPILSFLYILILILTLTLILIVLLHARVRSCFSGLAVYRYGMFDGCEYDAHFDCEHVHLHACMTARHGLRLFVLPGMKIVYEMDNENWLQWKRVKENYLRRKRGLEPVL